MGDMGGFGYVRRNFYGRNGYGRNPPRPNKDRDDAFKLKGDLPTFGGDLDIEEFLDWLSKVERFFQYADVSDHRKVKLVAYRLKGGASVWWDQMCEERRRGGREPIRSWSRMRAMLRERFLPLDYEQYIFHSYQKCMQGSRSVHEYTSEFLRLSARAQLMESESQKTSRYLEGLRYNIQDKIRTQMVVRVQDARNLALKEESQLTMRSRNSYRRMGGEGSSINREQQSL
ncbi:hypothetical protein M5689_018923 [Euphorbia peplus]|nr:hypothetical protein M5689_018923 [Euphorbia peplus]